MMGHGDDYRTAQGHGIDWLHDYKAAMNPGIDRDWFVGFDSVVAPAIRAGAAELCPPHLTHADAVEGFWKAWDGVSTVDRLTERHLWVNYARRLGYAGVDGVRQPRGPVRVYRGSTRQGRHGLSWTTSRAFAEAFADTSAWNPTTPGRLWATVAPPRAILAGAITSGHVEYLVDTDGLRITEVSR